MWKRMLPVLAVVLFSFPGMADAGVRIGIGLGFGIPIGGYPYYGYGYPYPYYAPYAYPGPVVVQQPTVVVPSPAPVMPPPTIYQSQSPAPTSAPNVVGTAPGYTAAQPVVTSSAPPVLQTPPPPSGVVQSSYDHSAVDSLLQRLSQADENVRRDAIMDLGRMKADRAIDSLTSVLANDQSPVARDAAARALGLIGSTRSLPALIRAAQADNDRDVRHSAQFAIEVIRSQLRR